ncbi:MAG: DegQ family serine endoprotease [Pseudomonadales bacterium]
MLQRLLIPLLTVFFAFNVHAVSFGLPDFTEIAEKQSPAVVKITTVTHAKASAGDPRNQYGVPPEEMPEIFRHFFERRGQPQSRESQSLGSGFIISDDGYVLTNHHVIDGADEILVRLIDRREFEATVVGSDERSDLALLKLDAKDLPFVTLAEDLDLKVGEWVLAIGSPFGLDYSVSAGIISAIGRSIPDQRKGNYVPFIQTDVAINPGNSGGPLFNLDGEVVGINSQIYSPSGGSVGLSFAIPIDLAQSVVAQLKESGKVARGWLGVGIQDVDRDLAESFGLDKPTGALVSFVEEDSPGDIGGLRPGDVITRFDSKAIETSGDLPQVVGVIAPGTEVPVELMREGKLQRLQITVGSLDEEETVAQGEAAEDEAGRLGLTVRDIDDTMAERLGQAEGVVVMGVEPGSAAAMARIRRGDVITLIGGENIDSVSTFQKVVKGLPKGRTVPMRIVRQGRAGFIAIHVPK